MNFQKGFCKIIDEIILEAPISSNKNYYVPFNNKIEQHIRNNKAIACCDASVKANQMGGFWILTKIERDNKMKYEMFLKDQELNTAKG